MKTIHSAVLSALPNEVKSLVRSGVYTLYTTKDRARGAYLLVTNRNEFYLLSEQGDPIGGVTLDEVALDDVVSFSDPVPADMLAQNWMSGA
jgi:hypothetical protein